MYAWLNKFIFDECGNFVGMCKSCFMSMDIFMDMGMEKKIVVVWIFCVGHGQILVGHWRIFF